MNGWEGSVLDWIQMYLKNDVLDAVMPAVTSLGNAGMIWILLCICLLVSKKHRKTGMILAAAMVLDAFLCNGVLKPLIGRARPFDADPTITLLIAAPRDASFPSGHTAISFAAVAVLYLCREKYWYLGGILAVGIAFSRLYLYVHYPTDVLGGVAVGMISGILAFRVAGKMGKGMG